MTKPSTTRHPVPPAVRDLLAARIEQARGQAPALLSGDGKALEVAASIGITAYVAPDGEAYIERDDDLDGNFVIDRSERARTEALVLGSRRIPELAQLLPTRGSDVANCAFCGGSGKTKLLAGGEVLCTACCGLGWIPATF